MPILSRTNILNYLINLYKYESYLEIGVKNPSDNFDLIKIEKKIGIDPNKDVKCTFNMISDEYFKSLKNDEKFDIIFIDGFHVEDFVYRDIKNSLNVLNKDGTIVVHDCNPPTKWHQRSYDEYLLEEGPWNGTVWKAFVKCRFELNAFMTVVNEDWGCGVIKETNISNKLNSSENLNLDKCLQWDYFCNNKETILNLISSNEFFKIFS